MGVLIVRAHLLGVYCIAPGCTERGLQGTTVLADHPPHSTRPDVFPCDLLLPASVVRALLCESPKKHVEK